MAKKDLSPRALEETRTMAGTASKVKSFKESASGAAIRSLEVNSISAGEPITIPADYSVFEDDIMRNGRLVAFTITVEGQRFFPSGLSRGASPYDAETGANDNANRVRPTGAVIDMAQKVGNLDTSLHIIAGCTFTIGSFESVTTLFRGQDEPAQINVWKDVDFVNEETQKKAEDALNKWLEK